MTLTLTPDIEIVHDIQQWIAKNYFSESLLFSTDFFLSEWEASWPQWVKLSEWENSTYVYWPLSEAAIAGHAKCLLQALNLSASSVLNNTVLLGIWTGTGVKENYLHAASQQAMRFLPTDLGTDAISEITGPNILPPMKLDFTMQGDVDMVSTILADYQRRLVSLFNIFGNRDAEAIALHLSSLWLKTSDVLLYDVCCLPSLQWMNSPQKNDIFDYHVSLNNDPNELWFIGQPLSVVAWRTVQDLFESWDIDMSVLFNQELMRIERYLNIKKNILMLDWEYIAKWKKILCWYSRKLEPEAWKVYLEKSFKKQHAYAAVDRHVSQPIWALVWALSF